MNWNEANDLGHHPMSLRMGGIHAPLCPRGIIQSSPFLPCKLSKEEEAAKLARSIAFDCRALELRELARRDGHCPTCKAGLGWICEEHKASLKQIDKKYEGRLSPIG